jgi:hypothetical protein
MHEGDVPALIPINWLFAAGNPPSVLVRQEKSGRAKPQLRLAAAPREPESVCPRAAIRPILAYAELRSSINVGSSSGARELLTRFDTGQRCRRRLAPVSAIRSRRLKPSIKVRAFEHHRHAVVAARERNRAPTASAERLARPSPQREGPPRGAGPCRRVLCFSRWGSFFVTVSMADEQRESQNSS